MPGKPGCVFRLQLGGDRQSHSRATAPVLEEALSLPSLPLLQLRALWAWPPVPPLTLGRRQQGKVSPALGPLPSEQTSALREGVQGSEAEPPRWMAVGVLGILGLGSCAHAVRGGGESELDAVGLLGVEAFPWPPIPVCRKQASFTFVTFPEFQWVSSNSFESEKGQARKDRGEAAKKQQCSLDSSSRNTRNYTTSALRG